MIRVKHTIFIAQLLILTVIFSACQKTTSKEDTASQQTSSQDTATSTTLFNLLPSDKTGITFSNTLTEGPNTNILMYEYFYNGAGVAIGDLNGDSLQDIYFTANMSDNKLYLNKGHLQFEDITTQAGVTGRSGPWKTGVSMADVNGDGLLDIYVCYSGKVQTQKRANQLFVNQGADEKGIPHFIEEAGKYGLASTAYSTQALFFDYDRDKDLDLFLLNHNPEQLPVLDDASTSEMLKKADIQIGARLFTNNNNFFTDVTEKAGIHSSVLTYGLGVGVGDINADNWPDIYIGNDYTIPDYLYINNKNGTFTNKLQQYIGHTSHFSMGNDIADINNDGLLDIFTLDMLPEDNKRQKQLFAPDNYEKFDLALRSGFHYQYMRNMLQINNGNGTFSEIGQLAGISNTDWSWAALFADYDNDGWKDLFVSNGFVRDFTNMDFMKYMGDVVQQKGGRMVRNDVLQLVHQIPSSNVSNYVYKNNKNLTFTSIGEAWGMKQVSNSNGAAYADLDNDGDLDLVINNVNAPAFLYQNRANEILKHHYLTVSLRGEGKNTFGIGGKVSVYSQGNQQHLVQMPARGYQSSVSPVLHVGLGTQASIDSLVVIWQSGKKQTIRQVAVDQVLILEEKQAKTTGPSSTEPLVPHFHETTPAIAFKHEDTKVNDFKRQPLLINPLSFSGPCLVKADVNKDGLEDIYAGGGSGQAGALYLQSKGGKFVLKPNPVFEQDKKHEDTDALFLDANGDGTIDLYVCSGGYDNFLPQDSLLQDRLYLGDGRGNFSGNPLALPAMLTSTSCVRANDINGDGYADLFVGGRVVPGRYPEIPRSYLLINDGKGKFTDMTATLATNLQQPGMVTDAAWHDLDGDNQTELIVVGEWMPIRVFSKKEGIWIDNTVRYFNKMYTGWWNRLLLEDFNKDGRKDLVVANQGVNTQCRVSEQEPAELYYKDFDDNGSVDPILCFYIQGKSYPYVTRDELLDQISLMRTRYTDYKSYAETTLKDIFTEEELKGAGHMLATHLQTAYFIAGADRKFKEEKLPIEIQFSPVFTLTSVDYDEDGNQDLLTCGNIEQARLRFGKYDANHGILLKGDGQGGFTYVPQRESGFKLKGDVRSVITNNNQLFFGVNNQQIVAYKRVKIIQ